LDGIDEEELDKILYWSKILRVTFIVDSTLLVACAWYNILTLAHSLASNFLAVYLFFLSMLLCCYEIAIRQVALLIVTNFGFMYSLIGRAIFIVFVAVIAFQLSVFGIVCFSLLLASGILEAFVRLRYPKYGEYLRKQHYYGSVRAGGHAPSSSSSSSVQHV
jgi:hypothetical protein